jgi:hypothetical protein
LYLGFQANDGFYWRHLSKKFAIKKYNSLTIFYCK